MPEAASPDSTRDCALREATPGWPRFLFVPVSGPGGAGEYHRCLALARAFERRWPGCRIRMVLNRSAPYAGSAPFDGLRLDDSPTRSNAAVIDYIRAERPDVVVFDSAGRLAQYAAARSAGARVVYVSSRPKTRWKGFRWRRMRRLDQHWIAQPRRLGGDTGPWERFKLGLLGRPEVVFLDTLHEAVDEPALAALKHDLGLEAGRYAVLCPGGGGDFGDGPDAVAVFRAAARELRTGSDLPVVTVLGTRRATILPEHAPASDPRDLAALPNGVLLGLVRDAAVAAVNGGSLLLQSLAQGAALVAAPIAGDQGDRIRRCAGLGCVRAVSLDARSVARAVRELAGDREGRAALRASVARLGLRDGTGIATAAVERLLHQRGVTHQEGGR